MRRRWRGVGAPPGGPITPPVPPPVIFARTPDDLNVNVLIDYSTKEGRVMFVDTTRDLSDTYFGQACQNQFISQGTPL